MQFRRVCNHLAGGLLLAVFCAGCGSTGTAGRDPSLPRGAIVEVNVMSVPVGLNLDGRPGVDSISIKVFPSDGINPKAVPLSEGSLDILMFDGIIPPAATNRVLLREWNFAAPELKTYEFKTRLGTGYEFVLPWGTNRPTQRVVTVGARYTDPSGRKVYSSGTSITVMDVPERD